MTLPPTGISHTPPSVVPPPPIEAAVCALSVFDDRIPPTINLKEPDPECDLDYVPNGAREHTVRVAMNNAYAFGGNNASLVLRKCECLN